MNTHCTTEGAPSETLGNRKRSRLHALILLAIASLTMLLSGCFPTGGGGGDGNGGTTDSIAEGGKPDFGDEADIDLDALFESFAMTEEDIEHLKENPILVTPENSPGNPAFINVTFTDEDYAQAEGYAALVTPDMPEADFPDFGIHVNLKSWNLAFESDTLVVLRMPDKYDEATNSMLYTYDYFLLSGQDRFFTDVEITAPVQGDPDAFMDFVTFNSQTGLWESVYTELAEDRRSFTAYMTHFSLGSERDALDVIQTEGQGAIDLYQQDGKSLFIQLKRELRPKYEGSSHYLYPVTLARTTNFEKFFDKKAKNQMLMLNKIMSEGGKIQQKDAFMTAVGWLGDAGGTTTGGIDIAKKTGMTFLQNVSDNKLQSFGKFFTYAGTTVLALNVADEIAQGKPLDSIAENNALGITSTVIGIVGLASSAFSAPAAAAVGVMATLSSACIFFYTVAEAIDDYTFSQEHPLGAPTSITEAAYHSYMKEYAHSDKGYLKSSNTGWLEWLCPTPTPSEKLDSVAVYEHFPNRMLDCNEKNWFAAYKSLIKRYSKDPRKLYNAYDKMFNDFADAFWKESSEVQKQYFRKACMENIKIEMYDDYVDGWGTRRVRVGNTKNAKYIGTEDTRKYPLDSDARDEWIDLQNMLALYASDMHRQGISATINDVWKAVFRDWDKDPNSETYYIDHAPKSALRDRSIKLLKHKTAPLVRDYYEQQYRQSIKETKDMINNVIVPLLNTRLTFYAQDLNHPNEPPYHALLGSGPTMIAFDFDCDRKPLFAPRNADEVDTTYHLTLLPIPQEPVLLETTVYHYLRYGCPQKVNIYVEGSDQPLIAKANWQNVKLETDENLKQIVEAMEEMYYNPGGTIHYYREYMMNSNVELNLRIQNLQFQIADTKIPIEFRAPVKQKKKEEGNEGSIPPEITMPHGIDYDLQIPESGISIGGGG